MRKPKGEAEFWRNVRLLTWIGWTMALPIAMMALLGTWLRLGDGAKLVLLGLGVLMAFAALYHSLRRHDGDGT